MPHVDTEFTADINRLITPKGEKSVWCSSFHFGASLNELSRISVDIPIAFALCV